MANSQDTTVNLRGSSRPLVGAKANAPGMMPNTDDTQARINALRQRQESLAQQGGIQFGPPPGSVRIGGGTFLGPTFTPGPNAGFSPGGGPGAQAAAGSDLGVLYRPDTLRGGFTPAAVNEPFMQPSIANQILFRQAQGQLYGGLDPAVRAALQLSRIPVPGRATPFVPGAAPPVPGPIAAPPATGGGGGTITGTAPGLPGTGIDEDALEALRLRKRRSALEDAVRGGMSPSDQRVIASLNQVDRQHAQDVAALRARAAESERARLDRFLLAGRDPNTGLPIDQSGLPPGISIGGGTGGSVTAGGGGVSAGGGGGGILGAAIPG